MNKVMVSPPLDVSGSRPAKSAIQGTPATQATPLSTTTGHLPDYRRQFDIGHPMWLQQRRNQRQELEPVQHNASRNSDEVRVAQTERSIGSSA